MQNVMNFSNFHKLPFRTIEDAANGDIVAIDRILLNYNSYILKLSTKPLFDEKGNTYMHVDHELYSRLKVKLISRILNFKTA